MSVHQILCLTIKILRNEDFAKSRGGVAFAESRSDRKISGNEDFANCAASGTAVYTLTPRRVRSIKTRQKVRQTFFGKKLFTAYMESATMQANDLERDNKNVKQNFCSCIFLLLLYFL